jgi:helix-turn-helix protein
LLFAASALLIYTMPLLSEALPLLLAALALFPEAITLFQTAIVPLENPINAMNTPVSATPAAENTPQLPFEPIVAALGTPLRWKILSELCAAGEPLMVREIAQRVGCSAGLASKHLAVLRWAGVVMMKRRLYQIPPQYIVSADKRHVDFGHCLLRLPTAGQ